jgi:hypothetical protein
MIQSTIKCGSIIENALMRSGMLSISGYGLSKTDLLNFVHESTIDIARKHFEMEKENYYGSRPCIQIQNGKFSTGSGASYDGTTSRLTYTGVTMSFAPTKNDVGKVITFFNASQPNQFFAGIISAFIDSIPPKHEIALFTPVPSIANVTAITIGNWLLSGDVIMLNGDNQVFSPENLSVYDMSNRIPIEMVSLEAFDYMKSMAKYQNSSHRWGRYKRTAIEFAAGDNANPVGSLMISAYWEPLRPRDYDSPVYASDVRLTEIENRLIIKLLSIKNKTFVNEQDFTPVEVQTEQLDDKATKEAENRVR